MPLLDFVGFCFGELDHLGYAIGFGGGPDDRFAGNDKFFLRSVPIDDYHLVFFQWAFAATAATTVSGCMAERTQFAGYLIYSFFITAFIHQFVSKKNTAVSIKAS